MSDRSRSDLPAPLNRGYIVRAVKDIRAEPDLSRAVDLAIAHLVQAAAPALAPPEVQCPECTRPMRAGVADCPWCKRHLGKLVSPVSRAESTCTCRPVTAAGVMVSDPHCAVHGTPKVTLTVVGACAHGRLAYMNTTAGGATTHPMSDSLPKRSAKELADALEQRADLLSGQAWEAPATQAMMREAAALLRSDADLLASLSALSARWRKEGARLRVTYYGEPATVADNCADDLDALIAAASSGKDVTRGGTVEIPERLDLPHRSTEES